MAAGNATKWFWGIFLSLVFIGLVFAGLSFLILANIIKSGTSGEYYSRGSGDKIGIVELNDVIITSDRVVQDIKKFREDKSIKAIILRINSPGGGVAASQEMYDEVKKTRESGKIIVVSMGSIAASGGYYVACGSNLSVANPGTLTGSIGVIAEFITIKDLADKLGIKENVIKSGKLKDSGNPFRDMNDSDRAYFQDVVNNSFGQFLDVVAKERKINKDTLMKYANGRVFTGLQAQKIGLVDSIGSFEDAIRITARMAGIEGEPSLVREHKRFSVFEKLLGVSVDQFANIKEKLFEEPIMQYKFKP
jgi:protease-4